MRKIAILLGFCLIMAMAPTFMSQPVGAMTGSGTAEDPYVIYNVTDLQNISLDLDAYYELANNIDASATSGWNGGDGFDPIGDATTPFVGHFDGKGYTISDLYIDRTSEMYVGLFGSIHSSASYSPEVTNVTFVDPDISGQRYVGVLVGEIDANTGTPTTSVSYVAVDNGVVYALGDSTNAQVGGLVGAIGCLDINGYGNGQIEYSSFTGTVEGHKNYVGGLVGYMRGTYATIYRCYSIATITGVGSLRWVGGLVGGFYTKSISQCYSDGSIGVSLGTNYDVGGLVGGMHTGSGIIFDSYSRVDINSVASRVGGFVGWHDNGDITDCYSTGCVGATSAEGGFCGDHDDGDTYTSFWDGDTACQSWSACGTEKTTPEMKTESTFTSAGWDFDTIWAIGGTINDGYPYFDWWYDPPDIISDVNQVVWFQPNAIILGTELPNRAQGGTLQDGEFHWGANPAGITISHGELIPEEEYDFVPISPSSEDIIQPDPDVLTGDVDTAGLVNNPLYPGIHAIGESSGLTDRLVWLIFAWFILIAAMLFVHIGFDTKKGTEKPHHFVLTTIVGLGLSILFYTMGIFPLWVVIVLAFGFIGAIVYERQPVL